MKIVINSLLAIMVIGLFSCAGESDDAKYIPPDLSGEWYVKGKGLQSECEHILDNYQYKITINEPWIIESIVDESLEDVPSEESESLEREVPEKRILVLKNEPQNLSDFEGSVFADQVQFSFIDHSPEGDIYYHFFGEIEGANEIKGHFLAEGPVSCVTRSENGSFRVSIN